MLHGVCGLPLSRCRRRAAWHLVPVRTAGSGLACGGCSGFQQGLGACTLLVPLFQGLVMLKPVKVLTSLARTQLPSVLPQRRVVQHTAPCQAGCSPTTTASCALAQAGMAAGLLSGRACLLSGTELRCWACRARLGNSADVSKGLRQLYASGVIARTGQGGRHGPFQYHARCLLPE